MKMKTKFVLIIIATLIIGFIIGFLTNGQLTHQKIRRFVDQGTQDGFKNRLYHIIKPDEKQLMQIDTIVDRFSEKIHCSIISSRKEIDSLNRELEKGLKPYLSPKQLERLSDIHHRIRPGIDDLRKGPPPPPPGFEGEH